MSKPKILFKFRQFPHLSETFIVSQIVMAIQLGFEVKILVTELLDFQDDKLPDDIKKHFLKDLIILEDYGLPQTFIKKCVGILPIIFRSAKSFKFLVGFLKHKIKLDFTSFYQFDFYKQFKDIDAFHVQYGTNKHPLDILKKIGYFKSKLIVSFHGHDAFFPINGFIPQKGYYDILFEVADYIIVNTPYLQNALLDIGCPKEIIEVIPVGVDCNFFTYKRRPKSSEGKTKLINVGRLDPVKGQKHAIEVVKNLRDQGYNIELNIVGEGAERSNLETLIRTQNMTDHVNLLGRQSQKEIRELLYEHDIFIFLSVATHDHRRETQGLATIEAQATGLPVIAFDSGGIRYTIRDEITGFTVAEGDIKSVQEKLKILIENNLLRARMGDEARNFVTKVFNREIIEMRWLKLYQN